MLKTSSRILFNDVLEAFLLVCFSCRQSLVHSFLIGVWHICLQMSRVQFWNWYRLNGKTIPFYIFSTLSSMNFYWSWLFSKRLSISYLQKISEESMHHVLQEIIIMQEKFCERSKETGVKKCKGYIRFWVIISNLVLQHGRTKKTYF